MDACYPDPLAVPGPQVTRRAPTVDRSGQGPGPRRLVLVPIGGFDRRAVGAVETAGRLAAAERRAVHVCTDERALWRLSDAWMGSEVGLPLDIVENTAGVAPTLARCVSVELQSGFDEVVLVLGRIALCRRRHRLLHDRTADAIARAVETIPSAVVALLTVAVL